MSAPPQPTTLQYGGITLEHYNLLSRAIRTMVPEWASDPYLDTSGFTMTAASNNRSDDHVYITPGTANVATATLTMDSANNNSRNKNAAVIFDDRQRTASTLPTQRPGPTGSQQRRMTSHLPVISSQPIMTTDLSRYSSSHFNGAAYDFDDNLQQQYGNGFNSGPQMDDNFNTDSHSASDNNIVINTAITASALQWLTSVVLLLLWSPIVLAGFVRGCFYISSYYYNMTISSGLAGIDASYYDRIVVAVWALTFMSMSYALTKFMLRVVETYATYVQRSSNSYKSLDGDQVQLGSGDVILGMSLYDMIVSTVRWIRSNLSGWRLISTSAWSVHNTCRKVVFVLFWMTFGGVVLIMVRNLVGVPYTLFPGYDSQLVGPLMRAFGQVLDPGHVVSEHMNSFWEGFSNPI